MSMDNYNQCKKAKNPNGYRLYCDTDQLTSY